MTTLTAVDLEPLTYWLRLEDVLEDPGIDDRLIDEARRGLVLLQSGNDLMSWIRESESLLRQVDSEFRRVCGDTHPELIAVAMAAPALDSLRSLLTSISRVGLSEARVV